MRDVAERVGLSRQLVSIVMRGAPGASDETRARVLAAARAIGYRPDDSARMLRRRRSGQIGVLFTMRNPFEVDLADALQRHADVHGYTLAIGAVGPTRPEREAFDGLMRQRIEALIVLHAGAESRDTRAGTGGDASAGTNGDENAVAHGLLPGGLPTLLLGGPTTAGAHDAVRVENERGIGLAVEHLAELGHTRVAYLGPQRGPNAAERLAGYLDAARRHRIDPEVLPAAPTEKGGHRAALELLRRDADRPAALVCVNDHCAIGALHTLVRAGVRVPEDVSIVGFDDSTAAALPFVELTSVRPDPDRMAALAIDAVRARIADPAAPATTRRVTPTLTVRASTAPPAH